MGPGSPEVLIPRPSVWVKKFLFSTLSLFPPPESVDNCPSNCYGNGDCISGTCHCFLGFLGPDCGRGETCVCVCACEARSLGPVGGSPPASWRKRRTPDHLLPPAKRTPQSHSLEAPRAGGLPAELRPHQPHCPQGHDWRAQEGQPLQGQVQ